MSRPVPARWIIAYDITDTRRLVRVHRRLQREALFVQRSVAVAEMTQPALAILLKALATLLADGDDLRAYRLPQDGNLQTLGNATSPGLMGNLVEDPNPPVLWALHASSDN